MRQRYRLRVTAIEHYRRGVPLEGIREKTAIDRRVLYRMVDRALRTHPDAREWGFRALIPGLHGEHVFEIERVWLLAVIDVGSRAILSYILCLRREYSRYDVIRTFERALLHVSPDSFDSQGPPDQQIMTNHFCGSCQIAPRGAILIGEFEGCFRRG